MELAVVENKLSEFDARLSRVEGIVEQIDARLGKLESQFFTAFIWLLGVQITSFITLGTLILLKLG